ncbi:MAG: hypothetical protein O3A00_03520 [Planctomycetota bacterium]|nr:hypothetical protein [Planctomycetota bacterium]
MVDYYDNDDPGNAHLNADFPEDTYNDRPTPPKKKKAGMSTGMKVFVVCLVGFGLIGMACCGGVIFLGYKFSNSVTQDPVKVQQIATSIIDVQPPKGFSPMMAWDMSLFGTDFKMAILAAGTDSMMIMEMGFPYDADEVDVDQMMRQMKQQQGMGAQQGKNITIEKQTTEKVQLRGHPAEFIIATGKDDTGQQMIEITGGFPSKLGQMAILKLQIAHSQMNEEQAKQFVHSIK